MILRWLLPLGFLGLLGIIALVLIYLLKPNYQKKVLSSTYIWHQSLKYRKKSLPFDIFKNFLLFLCQALIIILSALILAKPFLFSEDIIVSDTERIVIIDGSANMRATYAGDSTSETRFQRAVRDVKMQIDEVLMQNDGTISIILAKEVPEYVINGAGKDNYSEVVTALDKMECSNGTGDMEAAFAMAQEKLYSNPAAKVWIYSGTEYGKMGDAVTVNNLSDPDYEWNVAILDCKTAIEENEYVFYVDISAYGNVSGVHTLYVSIKNADNGDGKLKNYNLEVPVEFAVNMNSSEMESTQTITIKATDEQIGGGEGYFFATFEEVTMSFQDLNDSIEDDDSIVVYGGYRDNIRVQYYTADSNSFTYFGYHILQDAMRWTRNIEYKEVYLHKDQRPELSGFDFYIFEHEIPFEIEEEGLPEDGIVILFDPQAESVNGLNMDFGGIVSFDKLTYLTGDASHPLMRYINPESIGVTEYTRISSYDPSEFSAVLRCGEDPLLLVKNTPTSKIIILPFSINFSNFYRGAFQTFLYNLINYFMPYTLTEYKFDIGAKTSVNCKGFSLKVESPSGEEVELDSFPSEVKFDELGTYIFTTSFPYAKEDEVRKVFVRIPSIESGLFKVAETRVELRNEDQTGLVGVDIFVYFAIAVLALLFVEWWLHFRGA